MATFPFQKAPAKPGKPTPGGKKSAPMPAKPGKKAKC